MRIFFIFLWAFIGASFQIQAQCTAYVAIYQLPVSCTSDSLFFSGSTTTSCTYGGTYNYIWSAYAPGDSTNAGVLVSSLNGTAPLGTMIQSFAVPNAISLDYVCLEVVYSDTSGQPLDTAIQCLNSISYPQPLLVTGFVSNNSCGDPNCLAQFSATGGIAPYTYLLSNGAVISPGTVNCFDVSGVYVLTAVDANGCTGDFSFNISTNNTDNSTCQNSIPIVLNNEYIDTLCYLSFDTSNCGMFNYYQQGWYHFNSGDFTHISVGANIGYGSVSGNYMQPFLIEVYENAGSNTCDGNLVHCHLSDTSGGCFALNDFINLQPNTNYSLHVMAQWTSWVPMTLLIAGDTMSQEVICGCTNLASCNFNANALLDDGSCGYNGCTDVNACNYMAYANCDDGSCIYGNDLNAVVFHDVNNDGILQQYNPGEPFIGATGYFILNETGQHIYPNSSGEILLPDLASGLYTLSYTDTTNTWMLPGGDITIQLPACTTVPLGLIPVSGTTAQISAFGSFWGQTIHCIGGITPAISLSNTGTSNITGTLILNFDPILTYSISGGVSFDETSPGVLQWNISNQPPGSTAWYEVHFNGPGAAFVGQEFPFTMTLELQDDIGNTFYNSAWDFLGWVTCSYDPNDKSANPIGYTDAHYISEIQVLEYKIRFQNTGNATAFNVRVEDQIDIEQLDIHTFQLTGSSHDYSVVVDPSGLVHFYFNNIMLPDSSHDEPNSHGWLQYRIAPRADVEVGDVIVNGAAIYFDDNLPVITNDVTHMIYDCSMMPPITDEVITCIANPVVLSLDTSFTYSFMWYENEQQISIGPDLNYAFPEVGSHLLLLERSNPICNRIDTVNVISTPYPSTELSLSNDTLMALDGVYWEWYLNDDLIADSVQYIIATEPGVYYAHVYSAEGCMTISELQVVLNIHVVENEMMSVYPNPTEDLIWISGAQVGDRLELIDGFGRILCDKSLTEDNLNVNLDSFAAGIYFVRLYRDETVRTISRVVVK